MGKLELYLTFPGNVWRCLDLGTLLVEIGFTPLEDPILRQSIGQFVTLNRGAKIAGVSVAFICQQLIYNGYQPIGVKKNNEKEAY